MRKKFLIYVIVLIIFLSNGLIFAQQIPSSPTLFNTLRSINASNGQSGEIVVKLTLDQTLPVTPVGVSLNNPSRIYFDLNQVGSGLGKNYQETLEGDLRSINVVQVGDRTRVVLNLVKPMQHDIQMRDNVLLVKLVASPAKETRASPIRIVEASSQKQINTLRDVDFRRGTLGEGRVMVDMTKTNANVDVKQQGDVILVDFANTSLPDNLVRRLDVLDFATPIQTIETTRAGDNVRMVVKPHGRWEHSARQSGSQFILEVRALSNDEEEIEKRKRATGGYTGERLSLNFQDVEVRAILQVIADFRRRQFDASVKRCAVGPSIGYSITSTRIR